MPVDVPYQWKEFSKLEPGDLFILPSNGRIFRGIYAFPESFRRTVLALDSTENDFAGLGYVRFEPHSRPVISYGDKWRFKPYDIVYDEQRRQLLEGANGTCALNQAGHQLRLYTSSGMLHLIMESMQPASAHFDDTILFSQWEIKTQITTNRDDGYEEFFRFSAVAL